MAISFINFQNDCLVSLFVNKEFDDRFAKNKPKTKQTKKKPSYTPTHNLDTEGF